MIRLKKKKATKITKITTTKIKKTRAKAKFSLKVT
jgi:hypothetical protein